jgi:predicted RNase H-like HicB family nuclease
VKWRNLKLVTLELTGPAFSPKIPVIEFLIFVLKRGAILKEGYIILTFQFHKEGKKWVAFCEELGTSTFGRSIQESEKRLEEAVELHLDTLNEAGECENFFKEHNIVVQYLEPGESINVSIPLNKSIYSRPHIQSLKELIPA